MFSKLGDMNKMFEGMKENAKKLQAELESKVFSVKSGGGLLEVSMNGKSEVVDLSIDDSLMSDKQMLQILLIGAINDVNKMVQHNQQNSAMGMLGDMNLSGIK